MMKDGAPLRYEGADFGSPDLRDFTLSPAFLDTSITLASLGLCEARLQADARWPWIVLIPRVAGAREIADLTLADRGRLMEEVVAAGEAVRAMGEALGRPIEKLNVGLLGNITPQLHAHVVGRRADDAAWPGPVWGVDGAVEYESEALERGLKAALKALF
jgi:diadenosine tetraphosphate (Ap4A) HIT family hydrolase